MTQQGKGEFLQNNIQEKVLSNISDVIVIIDKNGLITYKSPNIEKYFGWNPEELIGKSVWDNLHTEDLNSAKELFIALLKENNKTGSIECRYKCKNGKFKWIRFVGTNLLNDREINGILGSYHDITEQKETNEELLKNDLILKATIESINEGLLIVDSNGRITHSNTRFKEIFSIPDNLLTTKDDSMLINYAKNQLIDPDDFAENIEEIYKSDEFREDLLYFKDNRIIERLSYNLQKDSPIKGRVWLFRDITEKKHYEKNLNKFKAAIDNSLDAIYWLNEKGGFDYINKQACKMLGYSYEELIQLKIPDIDPSIIYEYFKMNWNRLITNKTLEWNKMESRQKKKDGSLIPVEVSSVFVWMENKGLLISYVKDISERKKYEEDLLKNQSLLAESQRIAKIGSWILDLNTFDVVWSDETYEIFGYPDNKSAINLDVFYSHVHSDDIANVKNIVQKSLEKKLLDDIECRIITKNQEVRYVLIVGELISALEDNASTMLGAVQDITEQKLALDKLTKSAREKETLMKSMTSAFVMWEPVFDANEKIIDVRFSYINEAYEKMAGVKLEQVHGRRILDVWPDTELDWFDIFNEIIETNTSKSFDKYFTPTKSYYSCTAYLPWNTHDRICVVFDNITLRKLAEQQLRNAKEKAEESEYFLQESQRTGNIGSYKMDFSTGHWISTETLNNIFGIDDSYDKNVEGWLDLVHHDDKEIMSNYFQNEVVGNKQRFDKEYRITRKNDNQTRWVHGVGKLYTDDKGNLLSMLGTIQDITESKLIKDELQRMNTELENRVKERTAQLEQANSELEAFAYSVSHDLRAPIRHINGFLGLLQNAIEPADLKVEEYLDKIKLSSKNMSVMIDELLKFSRLGRTEIHYQNLIISDIITDILERFKPDYAERKIAWKINELPMVKGDPVLLTIALENLISNAIKYTAKKDIAEIEIGEFHTVGNFVGLYIKDNGVGFDMHYLDKLFGVFQRLHKQNEFEGVGIGLANVKQIILKHNGSITAESKLNEGATFCITLPN